jgi:hypothetical protein
MAGGGQRVNPACGARIRILAGCDMAKSDPDRDARLAAALRDNLRRRKAQARAAPDQKKDDTQPATE